MQEQLSKGKEVLKILINNGFEAYFIGEVVRNSILGFDSKRVDITTDATPSAIKGIFYAYETKATSDDTLELLYDGFSFWLHTFVAEQNTSSKILNKHYSKNLLDDLACRDYTINAIAMSHSGKLTDAYNGYEDIHKKKIRLIGKGKIRYANEPFLMIRAFTLISELNFNLSFLTKRAISKNVKHFDTIPMKQIYPEIVKIIEGKYAKKALDMMVKTKFYKHIPSLRRGIKRLHTSYSKVSIEELLLISFVLNGAINDQYEELVSSFSLIKQVYQLAMSNPKSKYDEMILFSYGLDICIEANKINWILGRSCKKERKITKQYQALKIKKVCDLAYKGEDILKIVAPQYAPQIPSVIDEVVLAVLLGKIQNTPVAIESFVTEELKKLHIPYDLSQPYRPVTQTMKKELPKIGSIRETRSEGALEEDYTAHRLNMLEQRVNEQDRMIRESDQKLQQLEEQKAKETVDKIVRRNMDLLQSNDMGNLFKDKDDFSKKLNDFMMDYIKNEDNKPIGGDSNDNQED